MLLSEIFDTPMDFYCDVLIIYFSEFLSNFVNKFINSYIIILIKNRKRITIIKISTGDHSFCRTTVPHDENIANQFTLFIQDRERNKK